MTDYLKKIEPTDVRFLIDLSEIKEMVQLMLGNLKEHLQVELGFDKIEDSYNTTIVRLLINLKENNVLTNEQHMELLDKGFSAGDEPFKNGDQVLYNIFGHDYSIISVTKDEDGDFITIEMPYEAFKNR
ncbi:hypothetical protein LF817_02265 [Halobacillus sp. A1]|uniref:hypothetical protein n=1 Tax=Halobacillus sp. A1 TaxID=2880262 RepID=UPI0020A62A01|nr:hypothetical protein [Halobacillus sp. A1]MCP3030161.1 hypothetical protein [Halobacillus sp. A1]